MGKAGQKVQTCSYKINNHGDVMYSMVTMWIILYCIFETC